MKKYTISKNFLLSMVFFCLLFTKTIFSEKAIHDIIERGRTGESLCPVLKVAKKYKK